MESQGGNSRHSSHMVDPVGRQLVMHISEVQPLMMSRDASVSRYSAFVWIHGGWPPKADCPTPSTLSITSGYNHMLSQSRDFVRLCPRMVSMAGKDEASTIVKFEMK